MTVGGPCLFLITPCLQLVIAAFASHTHFKKKRTLHLVIFFSINFSPLLGANHQWPENGKALANVKVFNKTIRNTNKLLTGSAK